MKMFVQAEAKLAVSGDVSLERGCGCIYSDGGGGGVTGRAGVTRLPVLFIPYTSFSPESLEH